MKECVKRWLDEQMPGVGDEMLGMIYAEYVETVKRLVPELLAADLAATDLTAVDKAAHTLKGNALMVGDQPMADAAIAFREALRDGRTAELGGKLAEMKQLMEEL